MKYLQGETIEATIESEDINLAGLNFTVWIYKHVKCPIVIKKEEMGVDSNGNYTFSISSEDTKKMATGRYNVEMVIADDSVVIGKGVAFELISSVSKGEMEYEEC